MGQLWSLAVGEAKGVFGKKVWTFTNLTFQKLVLDKTIKRDSSKDCSEDRDLEMCFANFSLISKTNLAYFHIFRLSGNHI